MPDIAGAIQDRDGNTSSKRVAGFYALGNVTVMMWVGQMTTHPADPVNLMALVAFTFGCFALTVPEWLGPKKVVTP